VQRPSIERGIRFHFYRYAPVAALNVFGYASAMRADVSLRSAAYLVAPFAMTAGWWTARRVARQYRANIMHGHWVVPGGVTAAAAAPELPLVISLHGSDVYVAERLAPARAAARAAFGRAGIVTACSEDLAARAVRLGADPERTTVVPYGVDITRFGPDAASRRLLRADFGVADSEILVAAAGRLVSKKGFEYLIDALAHAPSMTLALAGDGSLRDPLHQRAAAHGVTSRVRFLGERTQDDVARLFAAADIVAAPSIRDDAGNVDGLPNVVMEALASGTPLVTTTAGGIGSVVDDGVTALVVPERDAAALGAALVRLGEDSRLRATIGQAARALVQGRFGWERTAEQFELAYRQALAFASMGR
jgi:glycosyltransferase involved in cell wall biosynthesis